MSEARQILALSRRALARGERLCLVTVVHVEGSSYRKPGARMLLTSGGERAGTISGGCLEAEVSRKAWWMTATGPRVERYSSFAEEDGSLPYGLGCGGTVTLLLEQGEGVVQALGALERGLTGEQAAVLILGLGEKAGCGGVLAVFAGGPGGELRAEYLRESLTEAARRRLEEAAGEAWAEQRSGYRGGGWEPVAEQLPAGPGLSIAGGDGAGGELPAYFVEYLAPAAALTIFGAGDDAQPIVDFAHTLGWRVTVADGRAHLATRARFPLADTVRVIDWERVRGADGASLQVACGLGGPGAVKSNAGGITAPKEDGGDSSLAGGAGITTEGGPASRSKTGFAAGLGAQEGIASDELAIILTHSYEQDRALLRALLPRGLRYLGILGPRHRTERLLGELVTGLGLSMEQAFAGLHSPVGLDLGAGDPAAVALSILAEVQAVLHGREVVIRRGARAAAPSGPVLVAGEGLSAEEVPSISLPTALRA